MNLSQAEPAPHPKDDASSGTPVAASKQLNLKSLAMQTGLKFSGCLTPADSHFLSGRSRVRDILNLTILNRTAAEIAAAAFFEKFPGVELLGGKPTSLGFFFDFFLTTPPPSEIEILIEEEMRQIVREKRSIRILEMVPFSARALLLKEGHVTLSEELAGDELVEVVQIGRFHNLSPGPHLSCSSQLNAFKLWPMKKLGDNVYRLSGCAFPTKEELKKFLKSLRDYPEKSHERIGIQKSIFRLLNGEVVWLPAGLKMRKEVMELVRESLFQDALEIRLLSTADRKTLHKSIGKAMGRDRVAEIYEGHIPPVWDPETGLFAGIGGAQIRLSLETASSDWEGKTLSSLQLVEKTLKLLGFQHRLRLSGRKRSGRGYQILLRAIESQGLEVEFAEEPGGLRLEYLVEDRLGRKWAAFSIEGVANGLFITASVERLVALLLESSTNENGERH